jgi:hypothetical protein
MISPGIVNLLDPTVLGGTFREGPPSLGAYITLLWDNDTQDTVEGWVQGWYETGTGPDRLLLAYAVTWYADTTRYEAVVPREAVLCRW